MQESATHKADAPNGKPLMGMTLGKEVNSKSNLDTSIVLQVLQLALIITVFHTEHFE